MFTRDVENMRAMQETRHLTNVEQLRSFLRLCKVYQRLVSSLTPIAAPLTNNPPNDNRHTFPDMTEA